VYALPLLLRHATANLFVSLTDAQPTRPHLVVAVAVDVHYEGSAAAEGAALAPH
jgi:hypothetical protein